MAKFQHAHTAVGTRLSFDRSSLAIDPLGRIFEGTSLTPLRIGRSPRGDLPDPGRRLIITSRQIQIRNRSIWIECSCCRGIEKLENMGLRAMPGGDIRNQPQCPSCRSLTVDERRQLQDVRQSRALAQQVGCHAQPWSAPRSRRAPRANRPAPQRGVVVRRRRPAQNTTALVS